MTGCLGIDGDDEGAELETAAEEETLCLVVDLFIFKWLFSNIRLVLCIEHLKITQKRIF